MIILNLSPIIIIPADGLTFGEFGYLIVIDADTRDPRILTFNKYTGKLVKSCPYQPLLQQCTNY